jgi:hypothetical protein
MATYTQRLEAVRTAIDELVAGGQQVQYNGRAITMASLETLMKLEESYAAKAAQEGLPDSQKGRNRLIYVTPVS